MNTLKINALKLDEKVKIFELALSCLLQSGCRKYVDILSDISQHIKFKEKKSSKFWNLSPLFWSFSRWNS
jgi:hypothetical protein